MNTDPLHAIHVHLLGEYATHPIARRAGRLTALLGGAGVALSTALRLWSESAVQSRQCKNEVLAGWSLRRPRALPDTLCIMHSGVSDCRF